MKDPIQTWIDAQLRREAEAREAACLAALAQGCGVRETRRPDGVTFEVTNEVPFFNIHVHDDIQHWAVGDDD